MALASERPPRSIAQLSRDLLGAVAEMIALNGAWVSEGETTLLERTLAPDDAAATVSYARALALEMNVFSGLDWLVEHTGPGVEAEAEIVAFGDGENDLPMIERAGVGVAMGNAMDDVKKAADGITARHDEDGIAHALRALRYLPPTAS